MEATYLHRPGQRASKTAGGVLIKYVYGSDGQLLAELSATGNARVDYIYLNGQVLAQRNLSSGKTSYVHTDHLGTPRSMSDATGRRVWTADYDPFGQATVNEDPDGDGKTSTLNQRFPGQYFDLETGLHYNYFRDYDAALGRYVQSDPIGLNGGINLYTYVNDNPIRYIDPLGLYWGEAYVDYAGGVIGGTGDFVGGYADQLDATHWTGGEHNGWSGQDKYFHCRANCEAAQRGRGGQDVAECISDAREATDQLMGDPASASEADQVANRFGREQGAANPTGSCQALCGKYRPGGSFPF